MTLSAEVADQLGLRGDERAGLVLRYIAVNLYEARLKNGCRVLDASDMREWLLELAACCTDK